MFPRLQNLVQTTVTALAIADDLCTNCLVFMNDSTNRFTEKVLFPPFRRFEQQQFKYKTHNGWTYQQLEVNGTTLVKACVPDNCQLVFVMGALSYAKGPLPVRIA